MCDNTAASSFVIEEASEQDKRLSYDDEEVNQEKEKELVLDNNGEVDLKKEAQNQEEEIDDQKNTMTITLIDFDEQSSYDNEEVNQEKEKELVLDNNEEVDLKKEAQNQEEEIDNQKNTMIITPIDFTEPEPEDEIEPQDEAQELQERLEYIIQDHEEKILQKKLEIQRLDGELKKCKEKYIAEGRNIIRQLEQDEKPDEKSIQKSYSKPYFKIRDIKLELNTEMKELSDEQEKLEELKGDKKKFEETKDLKYIEGYRNYD
jgi:hypothetical protein